MLAVYPRYRQPRTRWLPPVPEHWNEQRAKTLFREVDERSQTGEEELLSVSHLTGITPRSQKNVTMFKAESYAGAKLCRAGDIVINTLWAWMAALGVSKHAGIVSPAYGVYRPHQSGYFNPVYLDYLLRIRPYVAEYTCRSTGIRASRLRLYPDKFLDMALIQPPLAEQTQIATYLRTQDAKIARFIRIKRALIERLKEQKLRLIDHAVTGGLDTTAQRKPSGVDWLGDVPGHWEVLRLKFIARNITNQTTSKADDEIYLALEHVQSWTGIAQPPDGEIEFASTVKQFIPDDVLFGKLRPYLAKITRANCVGVCVSEFLVLRSNTKHIFPAYLEYLLRCKRVIDLINSSTEGAKMPRADWDFIGNVQIPVPPIAEQHTLLAHIKTQTAPIDRAITQSEQEITLIREYRERLIADAVTGQIDLRGWQPSADDMTFEDDSLAALADDDAPDAPEDARDDDD